MRRDPEASILSSESLGYIISGSETGGKIEQANPSDGEQKEQADNETCEEEINRKCYNLSITCRGN